MDPSSRAALAGALLLSLLPRPAFACSLGAPGHIHVYALGKAGDTSPVEIGRCNGQGPKPAPPPNGADLLRLSELILDETWRRELPHLGYRFDASADRLIGPDGPMTVAQAHEMFSPLDASHTPIPQLLWVGLQYQGYRLDETTCQLLHPKHGALFTGALRVQLFYQEKGVNQAALETLLTELRRLPAGSRVPPELVARLKMMEDGQVRLPEALRQKLFSAEAPLASALASDAQKSYIELNRFFDGMRGNASFVMTLLPRGQPGAIVRTPVEVSSYESRLGRLLADEYQRVFERTDPGRELLTHFRDAQGKTVLPPMLVLKFAQRPDDPNNTAVASYDHNARQVLFNHWTLSKLIIDDAPSDQRARLAREFSDPRALLQYLEAYPEERRRIVENSDFMVFHEYVHFRQGDVGKYLDEQFRGNAPGRNPLSLEHEAHRQHCRYFLTRVAAEPALLSRRYGEGFADNCASMLRDPELIENAVTDTYMRTQGASEHLSGLSALQATRRAAAYEALTQRGVPWTERYRTALRLFGLSLGDSAITDEQRRITAERAAFDRSMPALREATQDIPGRLLRDGHPIAAMRFIAEAGAQGREEMAHHVLLAAEKVLAARDRATTREERLAAIPQLSALSMELGTGLTTPTIRAYAADAQSFAADLRAQAAGKPPEIAEAQLKAAELWETQARTWLDVLPPDITTPPARNQ